MTATLTLGPHEIRVGDVVVYTPNGLIDATVVAPPHLDGATWLVPCRDGLTLHLGPAAKCEVRR